MTITLQAVNELIASLESAGELSIKESKYLELAKAYQQLAAENLGLKAGASYFSYGSEHNFEWHKTAEEAVEAAEAAIDEYRGDACDGWSEEVDSICWGIIMQSSTKVGERPRNEDDCCDPAIDTVCDYALLPNIETPATDRIVAGIKADGVPANIAEIIDSGDLETICYESDRSYAEDFRLAFYNFRQLREGADK